MPQTAGNRLGPCEVLVSAGATGAGDVYRAADSKLGRAGALNAPLSEIAQDTERRAPFRRAPKACAQIDHANIVTIQSVDESDGIHFLKMQHGRRKVDVIKAFRPRIQEVRLEASGRRQTEKSFGLAARMKIA